MDRRRSAPFRFPRVQPASRIQRPTSRRSHIPQGSTATNWNIRAGQGGFALSTPGTRPNSPAADSVRSGEVDDPTGQNERFRRSETCTGGAGGTRTHGRRIMSPLRILATFVDQCRSMAFSQVSSSARCQRQLILAGPFLSLCPQRVLNGPHEHPGGGIGRPSRQLENGVRTRSQRISIPMRRGPFPKTGAEPITFSQAMCGGWK
jgi:hypothetical protein